MYKITLEDISLKVYLGVYDFEQSAAQTISVNLDLNFLEMPTGCISDQINDVICYALINDTLQNTVKRKRYHLIEHLGFELIQSIKHILTIPADICLSVHKKPPLENMRLAVFTIEEKWQK